MKSESAFVHVPDQTFLRFELGQAHAQVRVF